LDLELLVQRFQQKDIKSFEKLYELYSQSISGIIYSIVRDEELTKELLQDTFVKAWKNADRYSDKKGRFFTWLASIARNISIDALRSKSYKNSRKNVNSDFFTELLEAKENLDKKTDTIGLRSFIQQLNEKCKSIIEFIYFRGFSQKEVAKKLEIPLGTVKSRSRRCLHDLKSMLER